MENLSSWFQVTLKSLQSFGETLMASLPKIIGALFIIFIGWLIAKCMAKLTVKLLKLIHFDEKVFKINDKQIVDEQTIKKISPSFIISRFVYWIIILLFLVSASETLGWDAVSFEINKFIDIIPSIFIALLIFVAGFYIAVLVRDSIRVGLKTIGIAYSDILANVAFYIIMTIVTITAVNQIGIDTGLITSTIIIVLIVLLATFAISFGVASKDFLINILATHYSKSNFEKGMAIKVDGITGIIEKIDKIQVVLKTERGKVVLPSKDLIHKNIEIIEK